MLTHKNMFNFSMHTRPVLNIKVFDGCLLILNLCIVTFGNTVKPVYNSHPRDWTKLAVIDRWPLYRGSEIWPSVSL